MSTAPRRRATAWVALLAMLAFALLPTLSRALAAAGGPSWVEVCTAQGPRWSPVGADDAGGVPPAVVSTDHCPLCSLGSDGAFAPPPVPPLLVLPLRSAEPPALFLQAAHTPHAWRSAQPRAPPVRA